jgi:hypothetical protein
MKRKLAIFCSAALASAAPAPAQLMGAKQLKVAVPIKGAPSTKPVADVFYLAGEVGATETYSLNVKGPASITLFGPDGSEILTAAGSGTVKLEAVLPFTDVFTIAVSRKIPVQPYTLTRKTTIPTFVEASMASDVGYASKDGSRSQCWVVPGVKLRSINSRGSIEFTLAADRRTTTFFAKGVAGGKTSTGETTLSFDGDQVHEMITPYGGKTNEKIYPLEVTYDPERVGRFTGYLCRD